VAARPAQRPEVRHADEDGQHCAQPGRRVHESLIAHPGRFACPSQLEVLVTPFDPGSTGDELTLRFTEHDRALADSNCGGGHVHANARGRQALCFAAEAAVRWLCGGEACLTCALLLASFSR